MERSSGILLPLFSLPSPYGIGTMGLAAYDFADLLHAAGQRYWQMLPLGPTSYGDSPYQSFSSYAGNPYLIDLDLLIEDGLLTEQEVCDRDWGEDPRHVDYGKLYENRLDLLKKAAERGWMRDSGAVAGFTEKNASWLPDYALFMALKRHFGMKSWQEWPDEAVRLHDPAALARYRELLREEVELFTYIQFLFFRQWTALKSYINSLGIGIIGDLPIYVAHDSADVWAEPGLFMLDDSLEPTLVAGVPPDGFNSKGQLWGNPVFDWEHIRSDGYRWWIRRTAHSLRLCDRLRIDHFRGFSSFYAVPGGMEDAVNGRWYKGVGVELFEKIEAALGKIDIIAEDLGYIDDGVISLLAETGFPGMKILQFAFDSRENSDYLPHNYGRNCVAYIGTHDNDTLAGWFASAPPEDVRFAKEYLRLNEAEGLNEGVIKSLLACTADTVIITMQDLLCLGSEARMNTPSTLGGNWQWRMARGAANGELAARLRHLTELYRR